VLTLGDLLDERSLSLELVAGERDECATRPVVGGHSMETADLGRWLEPGWILLTVGMRLTDSPARQRRLVAEAARSGLAAIGFGVGVVFDEVPAALLDEARRRSFPVFTVPIDLPFRVVVDFVNRSLLSSHTFLLQRSMSMQRYLMDALLASNPREVVIDRVAELTQGTATLYRHDGTVLVPGGAAPEEEMWREVCLREPRLQQFEASSGRHVASVPILLSGAPTGWLVVTAPRAPAAASLEREIVRTASRLLSIIAQARVIARAEERGMQAMLLDQLLRDATDPVLGSRLAAFGLDFTAPVHALAVSLPSPAGPMVDVERLDRCRWSLEQVLLERHAPYLLAVRDTHVAALVQAADGEAEGWLAAMEAAGAPGVAGVGRRCASVAEVADSWRDAELAVVRLERAGDPAGTVARFTQFDLADCLLSDRGAERVAPKVSEMLDGLREHPDMLDALVVYLRTNLNVAASARALHLHPNSLRYRLKRVEEIVGRPLDDVTTVVDLYLALRIGGDEIAPRRMRTGS
jgi:purine catabolism regulator